MILSVLITIIVDEITHRKQELEQVRNQWKAYSISSSRRHTDVLDNNSIPGGP